jgi:hypothetical protein
MGESTDAASMFYLDLFRCLHERHVRYLLAGGLAMNLHGVARMTMDIDLVIALDEASMRSSCADIAHLLRIKGHPS